VERQQTGGPAGAIAGFALVLLLAAVMAGIGYEQVGRVRDRERLPRIGRAVDIGGRTLNIDCAGNGSAAVILESAGSFPVTVGCSSKDGSRGSHVPAGMTAQVTAGATLGQRRVMAAPSHAISTRF
jgi:hypothetical protein